MTTTTLREKFLDKLELIVLVLAILGSTVFVNSGINENRDEIAAVNERLARVETDIQWLRLGTEPGTAVTLLDGAIIE